MRLFHGAGLSRPASSVVLGNGLNEPVAEPAEVALSKRRNYE